MAFVALEKLINLGDGYRRVFRVENRELLLLQEAGERYLIARACPHAGQVLDEAAVDGGQITCPRHSISFELAGGRPQPPVCSAIAVFDIVYEGNALGVDLQLHDPLSLRHLD